MGTAGRLSFAVAGALLITPWTTGFAIGALVGAFLFPKKRDIGPDKIANLQLQTTQKGTPLQVWYGRQRIAGNVVWYGDFKTVRTGGGKGGKGGTGGKSQQEDIKYQVSVAIALGEGPIDRIHRIWANKTLVDLSRYSSQITLYKGLATQVVDPTINALQGGATASQPQWRESFIANGSGPTYTMRHAPLVSLSDSVYYFVEGGSGILDRRINLTRVGASPTQDQYTINNSTGTITLGGSYTNNVMTVEYRQDASGSVSDTPRYPYIAYVVLKNWDLGNQTSLPNFTFEASRRVPLEGMPNKYVAVVTGLSTWDRRNPETGALVDTVTHGGVGDTIHCSDSWNYMLTFGTGPVIEVKNANTGALVGTFSVVTPSKYGPTSSVGSFAEVFYAAPNGVVLVDPGVNALRTVHVCDIEYNADGTFKQFNIAWSAQHAINDQRPRHVQMDDKYVYLMAGLQGRSFRVFSRKGGLDSNHISVRDFFINAAEITTGPQAGDNGDVKGIWIEGSLLYVYWRPSGQTVNTDTSEVRVYDLTGLSSVAPSEQASWIPAGANVGFKVYGGEVASFRSLPLVETFTGVRTSNNTTHGIFVIGRMLFVDKQNSAETLLRAISLDDKTVKWTATHSVGTGDAVRMAHPIAPGAAGSSLTGENPAWIVYDYLTNERYGGGVSTDQFDLTTFGEAANHFVKNGLFVSPIFRSRERVLQSVENLMKLVDCYLIYSEGKFKLKPRKQELPSKAITTAAYTDDQVMVSREGSGYLLNRAVVHFANRNNDYTPETQDAKDDWTIGRREGKEEETGGEAITDPDLARRLAHRLLWARAFQRLAGRIPVGPQDGTIEPGDLVSWTDADLGVNATKVRILATSEADDGRIAAEVIEENDIITDWYAEIPSADFAVLINPQPHEPAAHTRLDVFELPPVPVNGNPSIVAVVTGLDRQWRGARLYASNDNVTYTKIADVGTGSVYGVTKTSLAATASQFEDTVNTVDVEILTPFATLISVTDAQWRAGVNRILIDAEIMYFKTATLVSGQRYTLSNFLRGMELTDSVSHNAEAGALILNQYVIVLTPVRGGLPRVGLQPVQSMPVDWSLVGRTIYFKAASVNQMGEEQALSDVQPVSLLYKGKGGFPTRVNNLRPRQHAAPPADVSDAFTRANSDTVNDAAGGNDWTEVERPNNLVFRIDTNRLEQRTGAWRGFLLKKKVLLADEQFSRAVFDASTGAPRGGPGIRASATLANGNVTFTGYWVEIANSTAVLNKLIKGNLDSGLPQTLASAPMSLAGGDSVELEVKDESFGTSTLRVKKNGAVIITFIDTSPITEKDTVLPGNDPVFGPGIGMVSRGNSGTGNDVFWRDWVGGSSGPMKYTLGTGVTQVTARPVTNEASGNTPQRSTDVEVVWGYTDVSIQEDAELESGVVDGKDPNFDHYRIKVYRDGTVLKRTVDNHQGESFVYTEAMNRADAGGTLHLNLKFDVSVISNDGGESEVVSTGSIDLRQQP